MLEPGLFAFEFAGHGVQIGTSADLNELAGQTVKQSGKERKN
jgi:hypothetical protein